MNCGAKCPETMESRGLKLELFQTAILKCCPPRRFSEYKKLAKMAIVTMLGSVEDQWTFSSMAFLRSKL